jgi:predicted nucleotidyltransferase
MGAVLEDFDAERLAEICRQYGIVRLEVFGSIARGEAGPDSDVDLLYELRPDRVLGWDIVDVEEAFEQVLGRPVDLIAKRSLHPRLRPQAIADARVLYAA